MLDEISPGINVLDLCSKPRELETQPLVLMISARDTKTDRVLGHALAMEGKTYEYTTMYPEFSAQARSDRDQGATAEFEEQIDESREHAGIFRSAASNFGLLTPVEHHHADRYSAALGALKGEPVQPQPINTTGLWICKVCGVIYNPADGDPDSGIAAGTRFEDIPGDWHCPICGTRKANFTPYTSGEISITQLPR